MLYLTQVMCRDESQIKILCFEELAEARLLVLPGTAGVVIVQTSRRGIAKGMKHENTEDQETLATGSFYISDFVLI